VVKMDYEFETPEVCGNFIEGRAFVIKEFLFGSIDRNGKWVVKNKYHVVASYQDGIARVELGLRREKKIGYVGLDGKFIRKLK